MSVRVALKSYGVMSPFGGSELEVSAAFATEKHFFVQRSYGDSLEWVAPLHEEQNLHLERIRSERGLYRELDRSALMGIAAARAALSRSGWSDARQVGVIIGSSRGATESFERRHRDFLADPGKRLEAVVSPTTTLGNISTSIAQDLLCDGPELSHSITCSTALHSVINSIAWMRAGLCEKFLVGGSEASLTDFTVAQMRALRIYAASGQVGYPCRPLALETPHNTFALGEGAVMFALEGSTGDTSHALAEIDGIGWAIEPINSLTGVSADGEAFRTSMTRAIQSQTHKSPIDVVVTHAPGTIAGDRAELSAFGDVFPGDKPCVLSPKWQIGHTFGASGAFGMLFALHLLQDGQVSLPSYRSAMIRPSSRVSTVLVNAAGFGGNVCSVILKRWS